MDSDWNKALLHYRDLNIPYTCGHTDDGYLTLTVQYTFTPFEITYHFNTITGKFEYITTW